MNSNNPYTEPLFDERGIWKSLPDSARTWIERQTGTTYRSLEAMRWGKCLLALCSLLFLAASFRYRNDGFQTLLFVAGTCLCAVLTMLFDARTQRDRWHFCQWLRSTDILVPLVVSETRSEQDLPPASTPERARLEQMCHRHLRSLGERCNRVGEGPDLPGDSWRTLRHVHGELFVRKLTPHPDPVRFLEKHLIGG